MKKINDWTTQWKMSFNSDATKQAQNVIFSRKIKKPLHTPITFNNTNVKQTTFQKSRFDLNSQLSLMELSNRYKSDIQNYRTNSVTAEFLTKTMFSDS